MSVTMVKIKTSSDGLCWQRFRIVKVSPWLVGMQTLTTSLEVYLIVTWYKMAKTKMVEGGLKKEERGTLGCKQENLLQKNYVSTANPESQTEGDLEFFRYKESLNPEDILSQIRKIQKISSALVTENEFCYHQLIGVTLYKTHIIEKPYCAQSLERLGSYLEIQLCVVLFNYTFTLSKHGSMEKKSLFCTHSQRETKQSMVNL